MASHSESSPTTPPRRPARDVIDAILENMRANLEPLKYSTLAPSRYVVYLHPEEFARLDGIVPVLKAQTARALAEELAKLNRTPVYRRYLGRFGTVPPPVESAGRDWQIEFLPDPEGELAAGDILVHSELALPDGGEELGAGQLTRRITTVHVGQRIEKREETIRRDGPVKKSDTTPGVAYARLRYQDNSGAHTFEMIRDSIMIGRGGIAYRADVRIDASPDVSREHARIRRDTRTGAFFIVDLSTLGTTLNGRPVPKGFDDVGGTKRENGSETALPDVATIGLAGKIFLDFRKRR